jgi:hypothetical protein
MFWAVVIQTNRIVMNISDFHKNEGGFEYGEVKGGVENVEGK